MIDFKKHGQLIDAVCEKYGINTPLRKAHFCAQIDHESKSLRVLIENLNYTSNALISLFSPKRISIEDANKYGRGYSRKANQEKIANIIYGGEWGKKNLGNLFDGDGWKFRGRGAIMCTGRTNYRNYTKHTLINFVDKPDLMLKEPHYIDFAGWYWSQNKINTFADIDNVIEVSKKVNGGKIGISERVLLTQKYKKHYNVR